MSLYDDLDVMEHADTATIKRAHRRKVSEHHPDKGGDREKFERVQHAYLVLSDPARRAKYDATGDTTEEPDNALSVLTEHLMAAFDAAVQAKAHFLDTSDVIAETRKLMKLRLGQMNQHRKTLDAEIAKAERLLKRVKFKGKGFDPITAALTQRVAQGRLNAERADKEIADFELALQYLKHYSFDFDQPTATTANSFFVRLG